MSISLGSTRGQKMQVVLSKEGRRVFQPVDLPDSEIVFAEGTFIWFDGNKIQTDKGTFDSTLAEYRDGMLGLANGRDIDAFIAVCNLKIGQTATIVSARQIAAMVPVHPI